MSYTNMRKESPQKTKSLPEDVAENCLHVWIGVVLSIMCKWTRPFWGTDCWRAPESLSSARQPLFTVPALRELESACRVSIL